MLLHSPVLISRLSWRRIITIFIPGFAERIFVFDKVLDTPRKLRETEPWSHRAYDVTYHERQATTCNKAIFIRSMGPCLGQSHCFREAASILPTLEPDRRLNDAPRVSTCHSHWNIKENRTRTFDEEIRAGRPFLSLLKITIGLGFLVGRWKPGNCGVREATSIRTNFLRPLKAQKNHRDVGGPPTRLKCDVFGDCKMIGTTEFSGLI